ncbi:MAG: hypothetical protein ACOX6J_03190 [Oscillospiraceae bacterium]|jgi:transposase-like protein
MSVADAECPYCRYTTRHVGIDSRIGVRIKCPRCGRSTTFLEYRGMAIPYYESAEEMLAAERASRNLVKLPEMQREKH